MNPKQAAKTVITGMAIILGSATAALTWGVSRGVITSVPADSAGVITGLTIVIFATIPAVCFAFRETAK